MQMKFVNNVNSPVSVVLDLKLVCNVLLTIKWLLKILMMELKNVLVMEITILIHPMKNVLYVLTNVLDVKTLTIVKYVIN